MTAADGMLRAWLLLILAGLFEVGFTTAMTFANRGSKLAEVAFVGCVIASFVCLQEATKTIPIGIGYAVWTGIGAVGTLAISVFAFRAAIAPAQIACAGLIIAAVAGLKFFQPAS